MLTLDLHTSLSLCPKMKDHLFTPTMRLVSFLFPLYYYKVIDKCGRGCNVFKKMMVFGLAGANTQEHLMKLYLPTLHVECACFD